MSELKKVLNFPTILLITINAIMGTGIFFLPAIGAKIAGPASLISWAIISIIAIYISMCFAELVAMFPKAGGIYEYAKQAFGRYPSFLIGWITLIAGNVTIAMLIVGAIQYLTPYSIPAVKISMSLLFVFIFNYIAYRGMKTSSFMLVTFSLITLGTLFSLILPGIPKLSQAAFTPFIVFPISSIFLAIYFIQETFFGWETTTFLAEETKNPEKVIPRVLIIATILIAIITLLFVGTALATIIWADFGESVTPLSDLAAAHFGPKLKQAFTLLVYLSIIGSVAGWVVAAPRLVHAMARDRLFITQLSDIHKRHKTPYKAIIFQTILTSILVIVGFGAYQTLLVMLLPFVLIMYSSVLYALVKLRKEKPHLKRPYTAPFSTLVPKFIILILAGLLATWLFIEHDAPRLLLMAISFMFFGIPIYYLLEVYYNPRAIQTTHNLTAYLNLMTERITLPKSIRKEIIHKLGNIKGKKILEFGCSVGTLTKHLAEAVGKRGKIYATDISEKDIYIVKKRMEKAGHKHVHCLHDVHHHERVHPEVPKVQHAVSIGVIGHLNNIDQVLKHMNQRLAKGATILFVDYDKFLDLIPNQPWLEDNKKIKATFKKAGFKVDIERRQGFAWTYIFIVGKKV